MARRKGATLLEKPEAVEASLWRRLKLEEDDSARTHLFSRKLPVAKKVAASHYFRIKRSGLDRQEFEQYAYTGLLEAIDRFDPLKGKAFEAFAGKRIKGAILDGVQRASDRAAAYSVARKRIDSLVDDEPEAEPPSALERLDAIAASLAIGLVAAQPVGEGGGRSSYETEEWIALKLSVHNAIASLPARERYIVECHYLQGVDFEHLAEAMKISRGRVSQLHRSGLKRLKLQLGM